MDFLLNLVGWLNSNQGAIGGITSLMIALFTFTLWWSTRGLWLAARDEIVAAHPPRIDARQIFVSPEGVDGDSDVIAEIFLANIGGNDATVIIRTIVFAVGDLPKRRPFRDFNTAPLMKRVVKAGAADWWHIRRSETNFSDEIAAAMARQGGEPVHLIGRVQFHDTRGAKHYTVFCRRYDSSTGRFLPSDDHDYEAQT